MTDLQHTVAMLERAGIEFRREDHTPYKVYDSIPEVRLRRTVLTVERGYGGFISQLIFTESGELVSIEAYE